MKKRDYGLDLCRILSMLCIVILHVIGQGGILNAVNTGYTINYWATEWIYICTLCSVDIFAIMSGYFGINKKKHTTYRAIDLMVVVLFFSIIITAYFILSLKVTGIKDIITGIFPALIGRYWYITNFIPVLFFQPFINKMLLSLSEKQHLNMSILSVIIFSVVPSVIPVDFFKFLNGYSFVWILTLYSIGAYIKRSKLSATNIIKRYSIIIFFSVSLILLFGNIFITKIVDINYRFFVQYTSPLILLMGLCIIFSLQNINIKIGKMLIEKLSASTFDIYIIHAHVLIFDLILKDAFAWVMNISWYLILPIVLGISVAIFGICSVIGMVRIKFFELAHINKLIMRASNCIDKFLYS